MARLLTAGAETADATGWTTSGQIVNSEGFKVNAGTNAPTIDTSIVRSGVASYRCVRGQNLWPDVVRATANTTSYFRLYLYVTAAGSSLTSIVTYNYQGAQPGAYLDTDLRVHLATIPTSTPVSLGISSAAITLNEWHMIEVSWTADSTRQYVTSMALRVNGVHCGGVTAVRYDSLDTFGSIFIGPRINTGSPVFNLDDIAMNDTTGTDQTSWPGPGKVIMLTPVSDNARGANWVAGASATTNLWAAVDNRPPVGVASGSATATSQLRNDTSTTSQNYDANMDTYRSRGLTSADAVSVVTPLVSVGGSGTTQLACAVQNVSNPAISSVNVATTTTAAGTHPTNWTARRGNTVYNPEISLDTPPVLRVGKRTSSTQALMVELMGLVVEYRPAQIAPNTAAVDEFERANEDPIDPTRWATIPDTGDIQVLSNEATATETFTSGAYWLSSHQPALGEQTEVWLDISRATDINGEFVLMLNAAEEGVNFTGFAVSFRMTGGSSPFAQWMTFNADGTTSYGPGWSPPASGVGDRVAITQRDGWFSVWRRATNGDYFDWVLIGTVHKPEFGPRGGRTLYSGFWLAASDARTLGISAFGTGATAAPEHDVFVVDVGDLAPLPRTSMPVPSPAGRTGDILVVCAYIEDSDPVFTNATLRVGTFDVFWYWGFYIWTIPWDSFTSREITWGGENVWCACTALLVRGATEASIISGAPDGEFGTPAVAPGVTTVSDDTLVIAYANTDAERDWVAPPGYRVAAPAAADGTVYGYQTTAGPTGDVAITPGSATGWVAGLIALAADTGPVVLSRITMVI